MFNDVIVGFIDYVGHESEKQAVLNTLRQQILQGLSAVEIPKSDHWDFKCSRVS